MDLHIINDFIYSCPAINNLTLTFDGQIDIDRKPIGFCREAIQNIPALSLCKKPKEIMEDFFRMRRDVLSEGKIEINDTERVLTKACLKCIKYIPMQKPKDSIINCIKISTFPALCQCKCVYCTASGHDMTDTTRFHTETVMKSYEKVFDTIEYAQKNGMIASNAVWHIVSGEITIHPYKNRIYDLVNNNTAWFFTNCFTFDKRIADNLTENQNSCICFSIDAGTPETWKKVKGVNNFAQVIENLTRYRTAGCHSKQIALKYIVLPGTNDNLEDYSALTTIMKRLNIGILEISRDYAHGKYITYNSISEKSGQELINATAYLVAILLKSGLNMKLYYAFSPVEKDTIMSLAYNLIHLGKV